MNKFKYIIITVLAFLAIENTKAEENLTKNQIIENLEIKTLNYHTHVTSLAKVVEHNFNSIKNNHNIPKKYKDLYLQFYVDSFNATLSHMELYRSMKLFTETVRENNSYYIWVDELKKIKYKTKTTAKELESFNKKIAELAPKINDIQSKTKTEFKLLVKTWELLQKTNKYVIEIAKSNVEVSKFIAEEAEDKFRR